MQADIVRPLLSAFWATRVRWAGVLQVIFVERMILAPLTMEPSVIQRASAGFCSVVVHMPISSCQDRLISESHYRLCRSGTPGSQRSTFGGTWCSGPAAVAALTRRIATDSPLARLLKLNEVLCGRVLALVAPTVRGLTVHLVRLAHLAASPLFPRTLGLVVHDSLEFAFTVSSSPHFHW